MKRFLGLMIAAAFMLGACGGGGDNNAGPGARGGRPQGPSPLNNWAAVVVGGDARTTDGGPTPIFDNARRDVAAAFLHAGFRPERMAQLSVNPGGEGGVLATNSMNFERLAGGVTRGAPGCLFYFSSHGSEQGITFGQRETLDPGNMRRLINGWCGARPTVVIISACHSGVFVPALSGPNRMVLTAARPDRSSFGCGGTDRYPYFDECVLNVLPQSPDFLTLSDNILACVRRREEETGASPPSEPQFFIGEQIRGLLRGMPFMDSSGAGPPAPPQDQGQGDGGYGRGNPYGPGNDNAGGGGARGPDNYDAPPQYDQGGGRRAPNGYDSGGGYRGPNNGYDDGGYRNPNTGGGRGQYDDGGYEKPGY